MRKYHAAVLLLIPAIVAVVAEKPRAEVRFEWNYINYTWPSQAAYDAAVRDGAYVPENNLISGVKLWKSRAYLSTTRWKTGVPATLAVASIPLDGSVQSPLLEPYPSWDMHKLDDCAALQLVISMEIDPWGRMWVIDNGRTEILTSNPRVKCPPSLVILDLENDGEMLLHYAFPEDVVHHESVFLNDIVLDQHDGGIAYITDTDAEDPGIVVFSLMNRTSWKVRDVSMKSKEEAHELVVDGTKLTNPSPVNGIALSPASDGDDRKVYYTSVGSYELFAISVNVLKSRNTDVQADVQLLGRKSSQSDGMGMSADGILYYGLLGDDAVGMWNASKLPFSENQEILAQDHSTMQWPNSFGFDDKGRLWIVSNRMHKFSTNSLDLNEINFRLLSVDVSSKNYQYYCVRDAAAKTL